jgi:molecular chaperone DnaK (HSP70)
MSDNAGAKGPEPGDRVAIGITFGNSNSSIAYTVDDKAEVIANEDGGMSHKKKLKTLPEEDVLFNFHGVVC